VLNVRKVVVYELMSLDGVAEKPDGFFTDWDDAMEANLGAIIAAQDLVILGRRSYGTACRRLGSSRSGARPPQLAICSSTTSSSGRRAARHRAQRTDFRS
jgi:hypothetical protein